MTKTDGGGDLGAGALGAPGALGRADGLTAAFELLRYGRLTDETVRPLLSRRELASLGAYRPAERAAAIVAAKRAVARLFAGLDPRDVEVLRREHRAPRVLVLGADPGLEVSLSHCDGLAAAAVLSARRPN